MAGEVTGLNQTITASEEGGPAASRTLSGMTQADAYIVPGDPGGPLAGSAGVIGMDTAGNEVSDQQQASAGFAGVARVQAAHCRLGRGERRAQVMADRREQRRPSSAASAAWAACRTSPRHRTSHHGSACRWSAPDSSVSGP